jgi:hypothetical protein
VSCIVASVAAGVAAIHAAPAFDIATVTRVENKATVAEIKGGQAIGAHPAVVSEVIKANNFLQTASTARAELEFNDKSLVRVGPNSIFSFDASSRTLSLEKGDMLFYLPPGKAGVKLKTAALTAAITGTVVLWSLDGALALEGKFTLFYKQDGLDKQVTLEAGTDHNAAKWIFGTLVVYQSDGEDQLWSRDRRKLLEWAELPDDAEDKLAKFSPWLKESDADYAVIHLYDSAGVGFDSDSSRLANRALATTTHTVTGVLPCGKVGIFDSLGIFLGLR